MLNQIPLLVSQSYNPDEVALIMSQKVVQLLYKNDTPLSRDIYVLLLEKLCEMSKKVGREVNAWLLYADDEVGILLKVYFLFFIFLKRF